MDKCGGFNGGPEVMLKDMQTVVGICCEVGAFAQLIDKLLLMQRAQVRYDEIFARFAGDLAMAEIFSFNKSCDRFVRQFANIFVEFQ